MNKVVTITIVALISIFSYKKFFGGDKQLVTAKLLEISKIAHTQKAMAPMPAALYAKNVSRLFTPDVLLRYDDGEYVYEIKGRNDLSSKITLLKMKTHKFKATFDILSLDIGEAIATAVLNVEVIGALIGRQDLFKEVRDIEVTLLKMDGEWFFKSAKLANLEE